MSGHQSRYELVDPGSDGGSIASYRSHAVATARASDLDQYQIWRDGRLVEQVEPAPPYPTREEARRFRRALLIAAPIGLAIWGAIAIMALSAVPAHADGPPCLPAPAMLKALAERYEEKPVGFAIENHGQLVQIYASDKSWSLVLTSPITGQSCIAAAGKGSWHDIEAAKGPDV